MSQELIVLGCFNGTEIRARPPEGTGTDLYIDVTTMCQANGRKWCRYSENKSAKRFLQTLSSRLGIPVASLVWQDTTAPIEERHTFAHRLIALHCAAWISPELEVWVYESADRLLRGRGQIVTHSEVVEAQVHAADPLLAQILLKQEETQRMLVGAVNGVYQRLDEHGELLLHHGEDIGQLKAVVNSFNPREEPKPKDKRPHIEYLATHGGMCPRCGEVHLVNEKGKIVGPLHFDHFLIRSKGRWDQIWPVCQTCNHALEVTEQRFNGGSEVEGYFRKLIRWLKRYRQGELFTPCGLKEWLK